MARLSKFSALRGLGRTPFKPDLERWTKICAMSAHDTQIYKSFHISHETFYAFLDKERCKEEQEEGYRSAFIEAYYNERFKTQERISNAYLEKVDEGDPQSVLFGMKVFNGAIEAKEMMGIEFKRQELMLKTQEFLLRFAERFHLEYVDVKEFAQNYFKDVENI